MRVFVFLLLFTITNKICAQDCKTLNDEIERLYSENKIDSAIMIAIKAKKTCSSEFERSDSNYLTSLIYLGGLECLKQNYSEAIPALLEGFKIMNTNPTLKISYYKYFLLKLVTSYEMTSNYDSAEITLKEAVSTMKKLYGENDSTYADWTNNLAVIYIRESRFKEAEPLLKETLKIIANTKGKENDDYATSLDNLGEVYENKGDYQNAEKLFQNALAIHEKLFGNDAIQCAIDLNNLGSLYVAMDNYSAAKPLLIRSTEIRKKHYKENSLEYSTALNNLALFYQGAGNYPSADSIYGEALKLFNYSPLSKDSITYAHTLDNIGSLYILMNKYNAAEKFLKSAVLLRGKYLGESNPQYGLSLNNLAELYRAKGDYSDEEQLLKNALTIFGEALGKEHPYYATGLNNLGQFYEEIGNYDAAEYYFKEGLRIREKVFGTNNLQYVISLNNIANLEMKQANYDSAGILYKKILKLINDNLNNDSPDYASFIDNIAEFYKITENYAAAEPLLKQALQIREQALGKFHSDYVHSLNNVAMLYLNFNKDDSAKIMFKEALEIDKKLGNQEQPDYFTILSNLGLLFYDQSNSVESINYLKTACDGIKTYLKGGVIYLSEKELQLFVKTENSTFEGFKSVALNTFNDSLIQSSFNSDLLLKSIGLQNITSLQNTLASSKDSTIQRKYGDYLGLRKQITLESEKSDSAREDISKLESQANDLEKDLMRLSPEFQKAVKSNSITWQDVQKKLKPNEAAIEYTDFNFWDKRWTDSTYYAAYVIRNTSGPKMIKLCELKQLKAEFKSFDSLENVDPNKRQENYDAKYDDYINQLYYSNRSGASGLYKLLWQPLDSLLQGVKIVYYAPSGLMNLINLGAVQCPDNKVLSQKYQLHLLASTRDITDYHPTDISNGNMLLYGGIQYAMDEDQLKDSSNQYATRGFSYMMGTTRSGGQLKELEYLDGSYAEEESIAALAKESNISCTALSGFGANEASFKYYASEKRAPSPTIVHISTHGFFFPDPPAQKPRDNNLDSKFFVSSSNPLLRCGLFMAGANYTIMNPDSAALPEGIHEDGILTGAEISNTNLRQTKLVVLSACETGLGKIDDNEGVYGLQRAFKMAGAQDIIMSLWKVNDQATKLFMTTFYQYVFKDKMNVYDAFAKTQASMRAMPQYQNPYYWAAFVLME